ncbi:Aminopeptidase N [Arsenophonus endosymbiont of Bemisia tabaci Q2]|nr:Aminopeptidase N [Arsenophonus endosymbiont of Bemisia tabaci Q2]
MPQHIIDAFKSVLLDEACDPALCDPALKAQLFTLPSENEVAEWFAIIDPIAIYNVINFIIQKFATEMAAEFVAVYHANKMTEYRIDHGDIAKGSLRNIAKRLNFDDIIYMSYSIDFRRKVIFTMEEKGSVSEKQRSNFGLAVHLYRVGLIKYS